MSGYGLTVDDLALLYLQHAEQHYRKNGEPTSELSCTRIALRHIVSVAGRVRARNFEPKRLVEVRDATVRAG